MEWAGQVGMRYSTVPRTHVLGLVWVALWGSKGSHQTRGKTFTLEGEENAYSPKDKFSLLLLSPSLLERGWSKGRTNGEMDTTLVSLVRDS